MNASPELPEISAPESAPGTAAAAAPALAPAATPAPPSVGMSWIRDLFLSVMIAVVVILFLYQPVKVEGTSMMPTLDNEERVFINKFVYRFGISDIKRGDTIVFLYPRDTSKSYIKRVIGLPGDTVEVRYGTVYVNNEALVEPYIPNEYRDQSSMDARTLRDDEYFVLGDHRRSSNDSRMGWTVSKHDIFGKAVFAYWPLEKLGTLH
jgi:signal peptidase I